MQVESSQLKLLKRTNSGTPARPIPKYTFDKIIFGTFQQMTWKKFQSEYRNGEGWVEGGTYVLYSIERLNIGDTLEYLDSRFTVKGAIPGRIRNQYHLVRSSDAA